MSDDKLKKLPQFLINTMQERYNDKKASEGVENFAKSMLGDAKERAKKNMPAKDLNRVDKEYDARMESTMGKVREGFQSMEKRLEGGECKQPAEYSPEQAPTSQQKSTTKLVPIGDNVILGDTSHMLMYLLATEFSKDPKIDKILKKFDFSYKDVNGVQLYPKLNKRKNNGKSK